MKTRTTLKTVTAFAILGLLTLNAAAQEVDFENIAKIDSKYIKAPIKLVPPPPPPPPPPTDDANDHFKMDEEIDSPDHIPNSWGDPIPVYEGSIDLGDKEEGFEAPDHEPGKEVQPVYTFLEENELLSNITVFPNPTTDYLNINLISQSGVTLKLIDPAGRIVLEEEVAGDEVHKLDLRSYNSGMYMLVIENGWTREARAVVIRR